MSSKTFHCRYDTPPLESELAAVPYHSHDLPSDLTEQEVIFHARRSLNEGIDLSKINITINLPTTLINLSKKSKVTQEILDKEGFKSVQDYLIMQAKKGKRITNLIKHSAIYQKEIVKKEYGGVFPIRNSLKIK
tara:strand:- start:444 stop:845 length:402 start_codon:yes stop_codon:yes gene_type:complete